MYIGSDRKSSDNWVIRMTLISRTPNFWLIRIAYIRSDIQKWLVRIQCIEDFITLRRHVLQDKSSLKRLASALPQPVTRQERFYWKTAMSCLSWESMSDEAKWGRKLGTERTLRDDGQQWIRRTARDRNTILWLLIKWRSYQWMAKYHDVSYKHGRRLNTERLEENEVSLHVRIDSPSACFEDGRLLQVCMKTLTSTCNELWLLWKNANRKRNWKWCPKSSICIGYTLTRTLTNNC